jgi:hypothetical protein
MEPKDAINAFRNYLSDAKLELEKMTPAQGIDSMIAFYREERVEGCSIEEDDDMLLFQWGTYDWGNGEFFNFDITRQLIFDGSADENIWQLSLTFKFSPTDTLRKLKSGNKWCSSPKNILQFDQYIRNSTAFKNVASDILSIVELDFHCAG